MLCMLGSHHVNRYKILKNIQSLCWSNKVETGNAVFMTLRSVFTSRWCHFGCGDLLSYSEACIMLCS